MNIKHFEDLKRRFPQLNSLEKLKNIYEVELYSLPMLKKEFGISYNSSLYLLRMFGIKPRSMSESQYKIARQKITQTCLKKYGTTNVLSRGTSIFKKRNATMLKKYGVKNAFQIPAVIKQITMLNASHTPEAELVRQKTFMDKYNVNFAWQLKKKTSITQPHQKLIDFLRTLITLSDENIEVPIGKYCVDLLIGNTIIEMYGDYWHASPHKYRSTDTIIFPDGKRLTSTEVWKRNAQRIIELKSCGYSVVIIWEHEIYEDFEIVKEKLCEIVKSNQLKK